MRCRGFLTDEKLAEEAARYAKAGARPRSFGPMGVLASTAVGLAMDIVTGWTGRPLPHAYLVYDGNKGTVKESLTLRHLNIPACPHFPASDVGDPVPVELKSREHLATRDPYSRCLIVDYTQCMVS